MKGSVRRALEAKPSRKSSVNLDGTDPFESPQTCAAASWQRSYTHWLLSLRSPAINYLCRGLAWPISWLVSKTYATSSSVTHTFSIAERGSTSRLQNTGFHTPEPSFRITVIRIEIEPARAAGRILHNSLAEIGVVLDGLLFTPHLRWRFWGEAWRSLIILKTYGPNCRNKARALRGLGSIGCRGHG
jgi:hypothetical protein